MDHSTLIKQLSTGDVKTLARCITLVENELEGAEEILKSIDLSRHVPVVGITGPPGAGKSTLVNALIGQLVADKKKVGVIAIDPTSPFNYGSLLGDRVRMGEHATNEQVYIRSLATRGALGGLSAKSIEIVDVMKASNFDVIIVETVGVGQSEIEIVGLADITVLVLVPESGDEIQVLKSGIMEIADIFVVNKSDRPGAAAFAKNITQLLHQKKEAGHQAVIPTIATEGKGVEQLKNKLLDLGAWSRNKKQFLMAEKAYQLIQRKRMKDVNKQDLFEKVGKAMQNKQFNLYQFIEKLV